MKGCVIQFQETCNQEGCLKKKLETWKRTGEVLLDKKSFNRIQLLLISLRKRFVD